MFTFKVNTLFTILKGAVGVIFSASLFINLRHIRFTTVHFEPFCDQGCGRNYFYTFDILCTQILSAEPIADNLVSCMYIYLTNIIFSFSGSHRKLEFTFEHLNF